MALMKGTYKSLTKPENKDKAKGRSLSTFEEVGSSNFNFLNTNNKSNANHSRVKSQTMRNSLIQEAHSTSINFSCPRLLRS